MIDNDDDNVDDNDNGFIVDIVEIERPERRASAGNDRGFDNIAILIKLITLHFSDLADLLYTYWVLYTDSTRRRYNIVLPYGSCILLIDKSRQLSSSLTSIRLFNKRISLILDQFIIIIIIIRS